MTASLQATRPAAAPPPKVTDPTRRLALAGRVGGVRIRRDRWGGITRALLVSGTVHALIAAAVVAWLLLGRTKLPDPDVLPQIEVLLGSGADIAGNPTSGKQPADVSRPVEAEPPPPPPVPATATAPPDAAPPDAAPPGPPPVPAQPAPPTQLPPRIQSASVTPPPPPPAAEQPPPPPPAPPAAPPPAAQPPPPQARTVAPPAPDAVPDVPPSVRLGDGVVGSIGEIADASTVVHRAEADTGNRLPVYPVEAARRHEYGMVIVQITIGANGSVTKVAVAQSSGSPSLDQAALDRLATWHFKPAMRDGLPQIDVLNMGVDFKLD